MNKIIPMISSGTCGPLGVVHLPRLWLKASLGAVGKLADGYHDIGPGYDLMVLEGIGIDPVKAKDYIRSAQPSYPDFEKWIATQPGVDLSPANIEKVNASVIGYHHNAEVRKLILDTCHLPDEGKILDAVTLNSLDDWQEFHESLLKS